MICIRARLQPCRHELLIDLGFSRWRFILSQMRQSLVDRDSALPGAAPPGAFPIDLMLKILAHTR